MRKKYFNWEDLGLGTIEQLSKDWGIPVEQLEEDQYKEPGELPSEEEMEKVAEVLLMVGEGLEDIETIRKNPEKYGNESDLEEIKE